MDAAGICSIIAAIAAAITGVTSCIINALARYKKGIIKEEPENEQEQAP